VEKVFVHLASHSRLPRLNHLLLAPFDLQRKMIEKINGVAATAASGGQARIAAKMNALTDDALINALIKAGQCGAKIDLIVRGACMLPAQVPGVTDNIHVRSVIGRFLEHTRIFYFGRDDEQELYLSSADWMSRNMIRRVELAWPVTDPALRQRIIDEGLVAYLHDNVDAWELLPDGSYVRIKPDARKAPRCAQGALMARYDGQRS
jgi:polyphosphate kinase